MNNKKIRVGIIGQGRSGRNVHANQIKKIPELYEIAAVSDAVEERRIMAVNDYGCSAYADYKEMLNHPGLDLIVNATPSHLHVPVSLELLARGFHVVCEKPLARTTEEVDLLIAASKKSGKVLTVMHQRRFDPVLREIQRVIASGVLGRLVQISITAGGFARRWDWQTLKSHNGGILMNTGVHFLDQVMELYDASGTPKVMCVMDNANSFGDAEDYCKILLKQTGKPTIDLTISSCRAYAGPLYEILGTNGGLQANSIHIDWKYFKSEEAPHQELQRDPISDANGNPVYCREKLKWYEEKWDLEKDGVNYSPPNVAYYESLYKTLIEGKSPTITLDQVRKQIVIMQECHRQNPEFAPEG